MVKKCQYVVYRYIEHRLEAVPVHSVGIYGVAIGYDYEV
jgi:hypothetical protein